MDIIMGEADKRIVRAALWLLRKKLGENGSKEKIHDDMINCGNPAMKLITEILNTEAGKITSKYQQNIVNDISELGLWVCYKDTAYRDIFFVLLDDILQHSDELRAMIKPYVKPADKWHVNNWVKTKEITAQEIEKGNIPEGKVSFAESVHVPQIQKQRLTKVANRNIKR